MSQNTRHDLSRKANRKFYDLAATVYEGVDGRRSSKRLNWLQKVMDDIKAKAPDGPFLEIGCGSGWLLKAASEHFSPCYGFDISPVILKRCKNDVDGVVASEAEHIPLKDNSVSVVAFFATLHHLPDWEPVMKEAYRILDNGGYMYCDHDMESTFLNKYRMLINTYRKIRNPQKKYKEACPELTEELYNLAEFHESTGVSASYLDNLLSEIGFENILMEYHWMGINKLFDMIGSLKGIGIKMGSGPLLRIHAMKGHS